MFVIIELKNVKQTIMPDNSAFRDMMTYLKTHHHIRNQQDFVERVGSDKATVSQIKNDKISIPNTLLAKIKSAFPFINADRLLTGEGDMLTPAEVSAQLIGSASSAMQENIVQVRFFDVNPTATFQELSDGFSRNSDSIGVVPVRGEHIDASYAVFEIHGDSMEPTIRSHARILCKEIPESRWQDAEGVVVISYRDKVVIKRITRNNSYIDNSLTLISDNPDPRFGSEIVQLSDIHAIFKAKRKISEDIY